MPWNRSAQVTLLLLSAGCARGAVVHWDGTQPVEADTIALAQPAFLDAADADPVRAGTAVGHVLFSGGYVTEEHPAGQQNVSREARLDASGAYAEHAAQWVSSEVRAALVERGEVRDVQLTPLPSPPLRRDLRGSYAELGRDNQPLPRFALEPVALAELPGDVDIVVVPWVVRWYSHNGGWFLGQTWGSAAGARARVFLVAYDASTGQPSAWSDLESVLVSPRDFNPNTARTEDLLLEAEQALTDAVPARLPVR